MTPYQMVKQFHETYGAPIAKLPVRKIDNFDLRLNLLLEEASEYTEARAKDDFIEQVDALADIVYVAYGAALTHGIPEDEFIEIYGYPTTETNFTQEIIRYGKNVNKDHSVHTHLHRYTGVSSVPVVSDIAAAIKSIIGAAFAVAKKLDVDLNAVLVEVHRSNMSKLGEDGKPIYRASDNKVLKGPNFSEPDIANVIAHSRYKKFFAEQPKEIQEHLAKFDIGSQKWYNDK